MIDLSNWINVNDYPPPENVEVLIFLPEGEGWIASAIYTSRFTKGKKPFFWRSNQGHGFTVMESKAEYWTWVPLPRKHQRSKSMRSVIGPDDKRVEGSGGAQANSAPDRPVVGPDHEVWIRNCVLSAMRMALALEKEHHVGADGPLFRQACRGIANGAAVEIIHTMNMEPGYVNLPRVPAEL